MLLFLSADAIMTLTLFAAFAYLRFAAPHWPTAFNFGSDLMAAAMTMFLLGGSFTLVFSVRARDGAQGGKDAATHWIAAAIAMWCCFILLEGMEWLRLIAFRGVTLRANPWNVPAFGATYFILTGWHLLHVAAGLIYLTILAIRRMDPRAAQWYVHFVNAVWLLIFFGLYLGSADLQGL